MDIQQYIESGILEQFCLGLLNEEEQGDVIRATKLYPAVKEELIAIEQSIEKAALTAAVEPRFSLKNKIMAELGFDDSSDPLDLKNLPLASQSADHQQWLDALKHLIPSGPVDFFSELIKQDDGVQQMLIVTRHDVPEEEHDNYKESFFILKGHCECTVGNDVYNLFAGDFLEIPLHVKHDIRIMSPEVVAVLQYEFVNQS